MHPAVFFAWLYMLTLTTVPAWSYYLVLLLIGGYTTGLGYLVRGVAAHQCPGCLGDM
jgi:hypothetical protein